MFKAKLENSGWLNPQYLQFEKEINIFSNRYNNGIDKYQINILNIACQPQRFRQSNAKIIDDQDLFSLILTHDKQILSKCSNARKLLFGTTWLAQQDLQSVNQKRFEVSFLCGGKKTTLNHRVRHKIWDRQKQIFNIKRAFYNSQQYKYQSQIDTGLTMGWQGRNKIKLFGSQFHIIVQNSEIDNYFSQKLIDCLYAKSVPIYLGCPNINKYFNSRSMILVHNQDQIFNAIHKLNNQTYNLMKPYIQQNYIKCLQFTRPFEMRIKQVIDRQLK